MEATRLVGAWRLVATGQRTEGSAESEPFGRFSHGLIIYSADGFMSAVLSAENRARFASDDPRAGTVEEQSAAYAGYMSYAGPYRVEADRVFHHVEMALFPNWVGTTQERIITFNADVLRLATQPMVIGKERKIFEFDWRRA
jgi:hypothetical protein